MINLLRPKIWSCGITHHYRYECMGVTTLIEKHIADQKSTRVLDAGCSNGVAVKDCKMWLENRGYSASFVAVDRDEKRINKACRSHDDIKFLCSDITSLEFENEFDVILCLNVIRRISFKTKAQILQKITKMLKPDGVLITGISKQDVKRMGLLTQEPPRCTRHTMFLFRSIIFRHLPFTCNRPGRHDNDTYMISREKVLEYAKLHNDDKCIS